MSNSLRFTNLINRHLNRTFSSTSVCNTKAWRVSQGLPVNRNAEGILTDGPDYTFLDGRPTPLLHKQKQRMLKQREYASQIVQMSAELDFAKDRYQKNLQTAAAERQKVIDNRLKPKGKALYKKTT
ncbi:large ribosomal subunit protein mL52 [Plodia interpunctella]|uniref:large ribosomal subunit protein mL52 n=1 Tax=Plodia interpunctella TaxID=58824 RepID=UPI00236862DB|nr:39S ribosomal protein L52, mitochondrial [Plodia interpunctella]